MLVARNDCGGYCECSFSSVSGATLVDGSDVIPIRLIAWAIG